MPNAIVLTGYGPPEVLKWAAVPLPEPGEGQFRIKVKAAGISPTDLALRAGYLRNAIPLPADAVLGFEAAGTVDAVGPGVTGTSTGDAVTALLFSLGGYAEYAVALIWTASQSPFRGSMQPRCPAPPRRPSVSSASFTSRAAKRCCCSAAADPLASLRRNSRSPRGST